MPGHLANRSAPSGAPAAVPGIDWTTAARTVHHAGGDPHLFAARISEALRAAAAPADVRALAGIAAWRAGALGYRDRALADIAKLGPAGGAGAAAALGLDPDDLGVFAERQAEDRFWWPGRWAASGYVCAVGGFVGLGGAWMVPPDSGVALKAPGAFAVLVGGEWWRVDADVWGSRLSRLDAEPDDVVPGGSTTIVCRQDSHLAWVHARDWLG